MSKDITAPTSDKAITRVKDRATQLERRPQYPPKAELRTITFSIINTSGGG